MSLGYRVFIAETQEKAIDMARPYFEEALKFAAPLGLTALSRSRSKPVADNPGPEG